MLDVNSDAVQVCAVVNARITCVLEKCVVVNARSTRVLKKCEQLAVWRGVAVFNVAAWERNYFVPVEVCAMRSKWDSVTGGDTRGTRKCARAGANSEEDEALRLPLRVSRRRPTQRLRKGRSARLQRHPGIR